MALTEESSAPVEDPDRREQAPKVAKSVAVGLLMFGVRVHYRVKDLGAYLYNYEDPDAVLEEIAYQALSDFAAQRDVDELLGPARTEFNAGLRDLIQRRLDELDTGIEVAFAGTGSLHPPSEKDVAATFLKVISAETRMVAAINSAPGRRAQDPDGSCGHGDAGTAFGCCHQGLAAAQQRRQRRSPGGGAS